MKGNLPAQHAKRELNSVLNSHAEILEHANDAVIVTDTDRRILFWNNRAEEVYGFTREEVRGKDIVDITFTKPPLGIVTRILRALDCNGSYSGELLHRTKSGKEIPVHISIRPVFGRSGETIGFMGIDADISDMKKREERIRLQNRELRTFRKVASAIASPMPTKEVLKRATCLTVEGLSADAGAILLLDRTNATFSSLVQESTPECLKEELASFSAKGSLSGRVAKSRRGVLIGDILKSKNRSGILPGTLKTGFRSFMGVPMSGEGGVLGTLEVVSRAPNLFCRRDLRFLMTLASQVAGAVENAALHEDLQESLQSKSRMVRECRHRLTNNLQAIASFLSTMVESEQWTGNGREAIDGILRRISAMASIQQQMAFDGRTSFALGEAMDQIEGCIRGIYDGQHEITFRTKGAGAKLSPCLASSLAIAINELVWNSCVHGFDLGESGSIVVTCSRIQRMIEVEVRDNGRGIPEGFELNRDAHTGLSIVRNLVERDLGGKFVLSRDSGTTATIRWPSP